MKKIRAAAWLTSFFLVACAAGEKGEAGDKGERGERGHSCTVTDGGDGTKRIACEDGTEVTLTDGTDGADGSDGAKGDTGDKGDSCTVTDNEDGTRTLSCEDGTEVVIRDGADASCAGNAAPVFVSAFLDNPYDSPVWQGRAMTLRVDATDPDGDALTVDFAGPGANFEPTDDPLVWSVTPLHDGGPWRYTVAVADGCHVVAGAVTIQQVKPSERALYAITPTWPSVIWRIDPVSGATNEIGDIAPGGVTAMAVNPVDGKVYVHSHDTGDVATEGLYELNVFNGNTRFVGQTGLWLEDMAFSPDGTLYGLDSDRNILVRIDLETGEATTVAGTRYFEDAGMAFRGEDLYVQSNFSLFKLDRTTGKVLETIPFSEQFADTLAWDPLDGRFLFTNDFDGKTYLNAFTPEDGLTEYLTEFSADEVSALVLYDDVWAPSPARDLTVVPGTDTARFTWSLDSEEVGTLASFFLDWSPNGPAKPIRIHAWDALHHTMPLGGPAAEGGGDGGEGDDDEFDGITGEWYATGLDPNTTYTFAIRLADHAGNVSDAVTATATTLPAAPTAPETLFGVEEDGVLYVVDPATGALTEVGDTGLDRVSAFAINPIDGQACLVSNDTKKLYAVDLETAAVTEIGATNVDNVRDLAFSPEGELFGWNRDSAILEFDLDTGSASVLESVDGEWPTGLAWSGNVPYIKIRNEIARWDENADLSDEPAFVDHILGDMDFHLGHALTFSSDGFAYTLQQNWDFHLNSLFRIDPVTWVATRVVDYDGDEAGVRLTSLDFLRPVVE